MELQLKVFELFRGRTRLLRGWCWPETKQEKRQSGFLGS